MAKHKSTDLTTVIAIPVTKPFRDLVELLAEKGDDKFTPLARRLLKRAVAKAAADAGLAEEARAAGLEPAAA